MPKSSWNSKGQVQDDVSASRARLALVTFVVGAGVGSCSIMVGDSGTADDAAPAAPAPTATKTVTEYKDRYVQSIPDSCMSVLNSLKAIKDSEGDLANVFIRGSDILSDGHEALAMKDGSALNEAREKLYKLDNASNDSAQQLSLKLWPNLERNLKQCKTTDAYKGGK